MKKLLAIILAAIMLLSFASCAAEKKGNENGETTPAASTPENTEPKDTEPKDTTPPRDPIDYNFVKSFTDLSETPFSFGVKRAGGQLIESTTTWYDGSNESVKNAASGQALTGYRTVGTGGETVDVTQMSGEIIWYTGWAANAGVCNVIVFTAPEDGTYDYDFVTYSWWGCSHSSTAYRVEVGGKVHNNNTVSYPKGSGVENKTDTLTNFKGTVELKAGETILFVYDAENDSSSDNSCIKKLKVTLN